MYVTELPYYLDDDFYLKNLVEDVILQLVSDTDVVCVSEVSTSQEECVLQITVDSNEIGKVIGKNRAIVQSLWNLVVAITRGKRTVVIQILNEEGEIQYPASSKSRQDNGSRSHQHTSQH